MANAIVIASAAKKHQRKSYKNPSTAARRVSLSEIILNAIDISLNGSRWGNDDRDLWRADTSAEDHPSRIGAIGSRVRFELYSCSCTFSGQKSAVLAAGIANLDWFADGTEPFNRSGVQCFKRERRFKLDGRDVWTTTRKYDGAVNVWISFTDIEKAAFQMRSARPARLETWDGNRLVRWDDCAWKPSIGICRTYKC